MTTPNPPDAGMLTAEQIEEFYREWTSGNPENDDTDIKFRAICDAAIASLRPTAEDGNNQRGPKGSGSLGEALTDELVTARVADPHLSDEWKRILYICDKNGHDLHEIGNEEEAMEWYDMEKLIRAALSGRAGDKDAERYRWLNDQYDFLAYITHPSGQKTYRLRCGEALNKWIDDALAKEKEAPTAAHRDSPR